MNFKWMAAMVLLLTAMTACDDTTDTIGTSLTDSMDNLKIATDSFRVTTRSILADSVLSRNTRGYLGRVKDPETGAFITGNFMTQFHTLEGFGLSGMPDSSTIASRDEQGLLIADSCDIRLFFDSYYGDSLTTMKLAVSEMAEPMKEGVQYYSNYSPAKEGLLRADGLHTDIVYSLADQNYTDSVRALTSAYSPHIRVPLNQPYTDRQGTVYNNYGTYLLRQYYDHPEYFEDSYKFVSNVAPGFFMEVKDGIGAMAYITHSQMNVYFRNRVHYETDTEEKDTVYTVLTNFGGTEEVLQTTSIENDRQVLRQLVEDNTCTYLKTPAGIFTEIELPVDDITYQHQNDTLSSAKIELYRINNEQEGAYALDVPTSLLLLERDSLYTFFEQGRTADNVQSFVATNSSAKTSNKYTFDNIANLVRHMKEAREAGLKENPNWLAEHPNWNRAVIVPVTLSTYSVNQVTYVARVSHDMSLCSTRLVGGPQNPYDDLMITVIYSKFDKK